MEQEKAVGSVRAWEFIVAALFLAFGAIIVYDSRRLGSQWGTDGPQAGYFPFYIGTIICISAFVNLYNAVVKADRKHFVKWGQLRMILTVLLPSVLYVGLIANPWYSLGIYVASALFIAFFMRFLGKYDWPRIAGVSVGVVVVFFLMFEVWFKVPLPKGPIEAAIGFG